MTDVRNVFDVAGRAMSAQLQRMNATASNLANADSAASTAEAAFRPLRPVFTVDYGVGGEGSAMATARAERIVSLDREPERTYRPDHPKADAEGFVYEAPVNVEEEMVEMVEAGRQYQNMLEAVSTLRTLMARTLSMGR
jgi:flagellar basal-body rod protein FlgC